jgi:hypothetical protein
VSKIVRLFASQTVTDDGLVAAGRAPSRQQAQRERGHPGSDLSSPSGSAIKRIKAGVKARAFSTPCQGSIRMRAFTLRQNQFRTKKEYRFLTAPARHRSNAQTTDWPV